MQDHCRYCKKKLPESKDWLKAFCSDWCKKKSEDEYDRYVDPMGKRFLRDEFD